MAASNYPDAPRDGTDRPRVLMLTHRVPYPPDRGDRIRAYHLLKAMAQRYEVTLAAVADEPVSDSTRDMLSSLTAELLLAKAKPMRRRASAARALLTGQAITPAAMHDAGLAKQLVRLHRRRPFDIVLTYCTGMIGYTQALIAALPGMPPRHVLDLVDVDSQKWARYAGKTRGPMRMVYLAEARRLRAVEAGEVVPFDAVTVISQAEADRYRQAVTESVRPSVIGNGVDLQRFSPSSAVVVDQPVLTFTGVMSYKPNVDAVSWFARRVMPRILAAVPAARFEIVGKSPSAAVLSLGELPGVRVVGPVDDTAAYLQRSAAAVAPMQIAPGVQNKVLEAMACGLAVVCSSAGASGIDAQRGRDLLIADDESDVAALCVRLINDSAFRTEIGTNARRRVEQRYHWSAALAPMLDLLDPNLVPEVAL